MFQTIRINLIEQKKIEIIRRQIHFNEANQNPTQNTASDYASAKSINPIRYL